MQPPTRPSRTGPDPRPGRAPSGTRGGEGGQGGGARGSIILGVAHIEAGDGVGTSVLGPLGFSTVGIIFFFFWRR